MGLFDKFKNEEKSELNIKEAPRVIINKINAIKKMQ